MMPIEELVSQIREDKAIDAETGIKLVPFHMIDDDELISLFHGPYGPKKEKGMFRHRSMHYLSHGTPFKREGILKFIESAKTRNDEVYFGIYSPDDGLVGFASMDFDISETLHEKIHSSSVFNRVIYLHPEHRHKGYGKKAAELISLHSYGFGIEHIIASSSFENFDSASLKKNGKLIDIVIKEEKSTDDLHCNFGYFSLLYRYMPKIIKEIVKYGYHSLLMLLQKDKAATYYYDINLSEVADTFTKEMKNKAVLMNAERLVRKGELKQAVDYLKKNPSFYQDYYRLNGDGFNQFPNKDYIARAINLYMNCLEIALATTGKDTGTIDSISSDLDQLNFLYLRLRRNGFMYTSILPADFEWSKITKCNTYQEATVQPAMILEKMNELHLNDYSSNTPRVDSTWSEERILDTGYRASKNTHELFCNGPCHAGDVIYSDNFPPDIFPLKVSLIM